MNLFTCRKCGQLVYFENVHCESCDSPLGFSPQQMELLTLLPAGDAVFGDYRGTPQHFRYCANQQYQACNWLVATAEDTSFCRACQLNRTIPDLTVDARQQLWQKLEVAKHRLVYSLLRLQLPVVSKAADPEGGLAFDFLADQTLTSGEEKQVMTGHAQGLVTININEADDAYRTGLRQEMGERYRTLLGHFRHEVGHYYWEQLVANTEHLEEYRRLFGDERQDYGEALNVHYQQGPPARWGEQFISAYASTHPWEDWAETWAHYLHMVDTLDTAYAFGLQIEPRVTEEETLMADIDQNPYRITDFDRLLRLWLPLTFAMNSINRSMGQPDMYPFVIAEPVVKKLWFVHAVCRASVVGGR